MITTSLSLLALAIAPGLFLMIIFYMRDRYEPEPLRLVIKVFVLGILSVIPAVMLELVLSVEAVDILSQGCNSYIGIALPEETMKFIVVFYGAYRIREFDEPMDGVVYSVSSSLGFATLENVFYVLEGGFAVGIMRGLLSVPGHAMYGAVMGFYMGKAKFSLERNPLLMRSLLYPILLHGTYDFLLFLDPLYFILIEIPIMIITLIFVRMSLQRLSAISPFKHSST